jgi:hypothetical protein
MEVIAEREIDIAFPDARTAKVVLRVGRPYAHPQGDFACTVQLLGLQNRDFQCDIIGVDSWQALLLGVRFLQMMLAAQVEGGAVLRWHDGQEPVSLQELFSLGQASSS